MGKTRLVCKDNPLHFNAISLDMSVTSLIYLSAISCDFFAVSKSLSSEVSVF